MSVRMVCDNGHEIFVHEMSWLAAHDASTCGSLIRLNIFGEWKRCGKPLVKEEIVNRRAAILATYDKM